jgi:hypothetical protein
MIFWGDLFNLPTFVKIIQKMKIKMIERWYLGIFTVIPLCHSFPVSYAICVSIVVGRFPQKVLHNI